MRKKNPTRQLEIKDLHVSAADGREILHGINLTIRQWEVHAIVGNDDESKEALFGALLGGKSYIITSGEILLNGIDITYATLEQKLIEGIFLGFHDNERLTSLFSLLPESERLNVKDEIARIVRLVLASNYIQSRLEQEGVSEKKRQKIIELAMLKPCFAVLNADLHLDVDALKYIIDSIQTMVQNFGLLLIVRYDRLMRYISPDIVHILLNGKIIKTGDHKLAKEIEKHGYAQYAIN